MLVITYGNKKATSIVGHVLQLLQPFPSQFNMYPLHYTFFSRVREVAHDMLCYELVNYRRNLWYTETNSPHRL
jgi:hypothetical protein